MVEIIGRTEEERDLEKKVKNVFSITSKLVRKGKVRISLNDNYINVDGEIHIHCYRNMIKIDKEKHFDTAFKLAEAYEKETGEKWKLKEMY